MSIGAVGACSDSGSCSGQSGGIQSLTPEEQQEVRRLRQIDRKVREHEAAHKAAGAGLTGGASYEYVRGPDGRQYAVAGEVKIDVSPAQTPEQTIAKAKRIQAAALAPADPSSQDRAVAAQAAQMAAQAQAELSQSKQNASTGPVTAPASATREERALAAYASQAPQAESLLSLFA